MSSYSYGGSGGGGDLPWKNQNAQYVSPTGNDANSGTSWSHAKLTIDAAIEALRGVGDGVISFGGGTIHVADGSQGKIWLRSDGLAVPGFHSMPGPLHIIGYGPNDFQFGLRPAAGLQTTGSRLQPMIWLADVQRFSLTIENFCPLGTYFCSSFVKMYDLKRKADGSIAWANILNWNRSGGQAVVTLAHLPANNILSATRVGTTVTLTFASRAPLPVDYGRADDQDPSSAVAQWIRITSTDPDFPSIDARVTGGNRSTTVTYTQAGAAVTKANIGTWSCHGLCTYDRMEVTSTDSQVATSAYRILATTVDTVTVADPYSGAHYGGASASVSVNNPGQYVLQDRSNYVSSKVRISNLQGLTAQGEAQDRTDYGPIIDIGGSQDGRTWFDLMAMGGYTPINGCGDPDRACWLLADPGSMGAAGFEIHDSSPAGTGIRVYGSKGGSWGIIAENIIADTPIDVAAPPCIEILESTQYADIRLKRCQVADNNGSIPDVRITGPLNAETSSITECSFVEAGGWVQDRLASRQSKSPLVKGQIGPWCGSRLAGDVPHARRAGGLTNARRWNLIQTDGTGWTLFSGATLSATDDPFGGNNAVHISGGSVYLYPDNGIELHSGSTWESLISVGDVWAWGGYFRKAGGLDSSVVMNLRVSTTGGDPVPTSHVGVEFQGDGGWEWMKGHYVTTTVGSGLVGVRCDFNPGGAIDVFMPFLIHIPASLMSLNDAIEYVATLKPQPYYLPPGVVGTMPGVKGILHGGLGVGPSAVVAAGTGTSIAHQMKVFDESGTLLGYVDVKT